MNELLTVERIVVESISKGEASIECIHQDTGLDYSLCLSIVTRLSKKGLIEYRNGEYRIINNDLTWHRVNKEESIKSEIKEVSQSLVETYFDKKDSTELKLQKVYMSKDDEKIFKALLKNVEMFVENLKTEQRTKKIKIKTGNQKVLVWGHCQYSDLVNSTMKAI